MWIYLKTQLKYYFVKSSLIFTLFTTILLWLFGIPEALKVILTINQKWYFNLTFEVSIFIYLSKSNCLLNNWEKSMFFIQAHLKHFFEFFSKLKTYWWSEQCQQRMKPVKVYTKLMCKCIYYEYLIYFNIMYTNTRKIYCVQYK